MDMHRHVYLAGPISGLSFAEAEGGWRKSFPLMLPSHVTCFSPMRGEDHLAGLGEITALTNSAQSSAIVTRDHNDVKTCDAIVANFLGASRASIGTAIEFGWADAYRKPIIMIVEEKNNIHDHLMLTEIAGYRVSSLEDAATIIKHLFTA